MSDNYEVVEVLNKLGMELEAIRESLERIERMQYIREGNVSDKYHRGIRARLSELNDRLGV